MEHEYLIIEKQGEDLVVTGLKDNAPSDIVIPEGVTNVEHYSFLCRKSFTPIKLLCLLISLIFLVSCHPEKKPLRELESFTKNLIIKNKDFSSDEWIAAVKEYTKIEKEINSYKDDYTYEEKQEIAKLENICKKHFRDMIPVTVGEKIESVGYIVEETVEGIDKAFDKCRNN